MGTLNIYLKGLISQKNDTVIRIDIGVSGIVVPFGTIAPKLMMSVRSWPPGENSPHIIGFSWIVAPSGDYPQIIDVSGIVATSGRIHTQIIGVSGRKQAPNDWCQWDSDPQGRIAPHWCQWDFGHK